MYLDLKGKTAVITGSSSGIGAATARRLASEGVNVVINHFSDEKGALEVQRDITSAGGRAVIVQGDVRSEEHIHAMYVKAIDEFGDLDIWVNNAGIQKYVPSHELELEEWRRVIDTNLTGTFLGLREAINHYLSSGKKGIAVNVSSVHEIIPWPGYAHYASSKGGIKLLTQSLALEYAPKGIRINSVAPGGIDTPINAESLSNPEQRAKDEQGIPLGYIGRPEEMAAVVAWLASSESSYVTGATIIADGGLTLYPACER